MVPLLRLPDKDFWGESILCHGILDCLNSFASALSLFLEKVTEESERSDPSKWRSLEILPRLSPRSDIWRGQWTLTNPIGYLRSGLVSSSCASGDVRASRQLPGAAPSAGVILFVGKIEKPGSLRSSIVGHIAGWCRSIIKLHRTYVYRCLGFATALEKKNPSCGGLLGTRHRFVGQPADLEADKST